LEICDESNVVRVDYDDHVGDVADGFIKMLHQLGCNVERISTEGIPSLAYRVTLPQK
jgi:hypothetical protein